MLAQLLAEPGVEEVCELGSRFGFLALHGGNLERVTDHLAIEAARASGASVYAIRQPDGFRWHLPATSMDPADSPQLRAFLDHVDVVVSIHGFGVESLWNPRSPKVFADGLPYRPERALLIGGGNRDLAARLAAVLAEHVPGYDPVSDLDLIPKRLRGLHPANPVNLPRCGGVQLECCPDVRGQGRAWWGRATLHQPHPPETGSLVAALAAVARSASAGS